MRCLLSLGLVLVACVFVTDAVAGKGDKKKAMAAFNKGIAFYKEGRMEAAVKKFRHADALNPSWKIKYNIGQCEASLKRYGLAIEAFEQYLGGGGDDVPIERRDAVLKELDRLRRMVGTITVTGEAGVDIFVASIKRGNTSSPTSIKVTAGVEHEITFMKDGEKLGAVKLTVSGGEVVALPTETQQPKVVAVQSPGSAAVAATPQTATPSADKGANPMVYPTMAELKRAYRARRVDKVQYRDNQRIIQKKRQVEYNKLKADLRAGKITRREYKISVREIRAKYEGK